MNILILGDIMGPSGSKVLIEKLPKLIKEKDINDMVLGGLSPNILLDTINEHKFSGLSAKMTLSDWSKVSGK